jgi:hypothetical protein
MKTRMLLILLALLILGTSLAAAASPRVMVAYYTDQREYNSLSVYTMSDRLPLGLSFWGLTDLHGEQYGERRWDLVRSFSEYRLTRGGLFGLANLGVQVEYDDMTAIGKGVGRMGLAWSHSIPMPASGKGRLIWRTHPVETDGEGWQASLTFLLTFTDVISVTGFLDRDDHDDFARWIFEPQLNIRIHERTWIVFEYRSNGYERAAPHLDGTGYAAGLRIDL